MTDDLATERWPGELSWLRGEVTRLTVLEAVRTDRFGLGNVPHNEFVRQAETTVALLAPVVVAELRRRGALDRIVRAIELQTAHMRALDTLRQAIEEAD